MHLPVFWCTYMNNLVIIAGEIGGTFNCESDKVISPKYLSCLTVSCVCGVIDKSPSWFVTTVTGPYV